MQHFMDNILFMLYLNVVTRQYLLNFLSSDDTKMHNNSSDVSIFGERERKDIDVPFYEFGSVLQATENFSDSHKLGQGGFGHVYKVYSFNVFLLYIQNEAFTTSDLNESSNSTCNIDFLFV